MSIRTPGNRSGAPFASWIHPAIRFDPAKDPVVLTHPIFAAIWAAAPQGLADFGLNSFPILLMDGRQDRLQRQAAAASLRIETEGSGEPFVTGKMIGLARSKPRCR